MTKGFERGLAAHSAAAWEDDLTPADRAALAELPPRSDVDRDRRREQLRATAHRLHAALRELVTDVTYHVWLEALTVEDATTDHLWVGADEHRRTWVRERFTRLLEQAAAELADRPMTVDVIPAPPPPAPTREEPTDAQPF